MEKGIMVELGILEHIGLILQKNMKNPGGKRYLEEKGNAMGFSIYKRILLWIASLITYLPYTKKLSLLVDRITIYTEKGR